MESVEEDNSHDEFDPDDLDGPSASSAVVATATAGAGGSSMIQRVLISAISDLKEFTGKDQDEDRARTWISKVKSALMRDIASDAEKCLSFADLLAGPARNWYRQLSRSTRKKWPDLLRSFQTQYCGLGVSVARQYYHARRRSDESPLEYLHRLNVAGLRAKLKIKDGGSKVLREHADHFIETLGDVDLADRLTLFRLPDADELEEVLRAVDRAKHRQKKAAVGSGKYRHKAPTPTTPSSTSRDLMDGTAQVRLCRLGFLTRVKENELKKKEARATGVRSQIKRTPGQPKAAYTLKAKGTKPITMAAQPFVDLM
ncbi:hypothetical protein PInf_025045 [Phytophthora infestans]|nr:hypothetical protein PInf_025045 [Phytophthora infestans]